MNKDQINYNDIIKLRNGEFGMLAHYNTVLDRVSIAIITKNRVIPFCEYHNELLHGSTDDLDIVKIIGCNNKVLQLEIVAGTYVFIEVAGGSNVKWERKEPVKHTYDELCQKLGYEFELVEDY